MLGELKDGHVNLGASFDFGRNWSYFEDYPDNYNAELIRKIAADLARILIERDDDERDDIILIRADLLRRSREFEKLISEYDGISLDDEVKNKTLTFQIEKARKGDDLCYTYHDVIGGDEYLFG